MKFTVIPNNFWDARFDGKTTELPIQAENANYGIYGTIITLFLQENHLVIDQLGEIDQLIKKNPNLPWLIAFRLHTTMKQFHNIRVGGELSDALILQHIKSGTPTPETDDEKINFTPAQLAKTLAFCRTGEKLEPQNAYFTWMRAYFLLIDSQDAKAWQALHEAAHKTYWNDHFIDFQNLYAQSSSKILNRPLSPIEKFIIPAGFSGFFIAGKTREIARVITWQGIKQNRAGHPEKALQIWSDGYQTFTLAAQGEDNELNYLVEDAVLEMFASGINSSNRMIYEKHSNKPHPSAKKITSLVNFAQKYHRPDLANELQNDWRKNNFIQQKFLVSSDVTLYRSFHGLALAELICALTMPGVVLILLLLGALFLWIITACLNHFCNNKNREAQNAPPPGLWRKFSGVIICSGVISFFGGLLFIYLLKFLPNADLSSGWAISGLFNSGDDSSWRGRILDSALGFFMGIDTPWRFLIFLTPLVCAIFYALHKMKEEEKKNYKHPVLVKTVKLLHLFLLFSAWGALVMVSDYETAEIVTTSLIGVFLLVSFAWMFVTTRKTSAVKTLRLLQAASIGVMCLSSILIVPILIKQTAVERQLKPWADNSLQGEMRQYHHVVDEPPGKH